MTIDLRLGRWQDALADVECDHLISDPPYSARTHAGFDATQGADGADRRELNYAAWTEDDVNAFVDHWSPRTRGWMVIITDHILAPDFAAAMREDGRVTFAPLPLVEMGSRVRLQGDGPSLWACQVVVSRPRKAPYSKWGALPGAYVVPREAKPVIGGKPLGVMRALVRDYSRPGDLIADPCSGGATTLLAARMEGRRGIGAEADPVTHAEAMERIALMPVGPRGQTALFDNVNGNERETK